MAETTTKLPIKTEDKKVEKAVALQAGTRSKPSTVKSIDCSRTSALTAGRRRSAAPPWTSSRSGGVN